MKALIKKLGEVRIFFICLALLYLTYAVFEYSEIKEITSITLNTVLIIELVLFYPVRYVLIGVVGFKIDQIKTPKLSPTFWISFSIILVGLFFCGTYYFVNKDNGRYEYQDGLVIDKKAGTAKPITINRE